MRKCKTHLSAEVSTSKSKYSPSDIARFWKYVSKQPGEDGCWLWTGCCSRGYGKIQVKGKGVSVHRFSFYIHSGEIPDGAYICHACDVKNCVRPSHIWLGDAATNSLDCVIKGRTLTGDSHPMRLHPEKASRGDRNASRKYPEKRPRGENHWSRRNPEKYRRGDNHHARINPACMRRGQDHGHAKLSDADVLEIRRLYAEGFRPQWLLGEKFGISQSMVSFITLKQHWKHLK